LPLGFSSRHSPLTQRFITREPTLPKPRRLDNPTQYLRENRLPRRLRVLPARPSLGCPPRGGAGSARPEGTHTANPNVASSWPPAHRKRTGGNAMPRLEFGLGTRTRRARPSEKIAFRAVPGFPRARPSSHRLAIPRRGGLARPRGRHPPHQGISPLGRRPFAYASG
jgi:hypothetical protein